MQAPEDLLQAYTPAAHYTTRVLGARGRGEKDASGSWAAGGGVGKAPGLADEEEAEEAAARVMGAAQDERRFQEEGRHLSLGAWGGGGQPPEVLYQDRNGYTIQDIRVVAGDEALTKYR